MILNELQTKRFMGFLSNKGDTMSEDLEDLEDLRDHFAGIALAALIQRVREDHNVNPEGAAAFSYRIADAMIAERGKLRGTK